MLGYNMFSYCGNNPVMHTDPSGTDYSLIGGGFQFELDWGGATVGIEIIVYWDVDECENEGFQIAVYCYQGISIGVDDAFIAAMIATVMDNVDMLVNGSEEEIVAMATLLSAEYSVGISGVAIWGNEDFSTTEDYNGPFTSISASSGSVRGGFAYSSNCFAVSLGGNAIGFQIVPCLNVATTEYKQLFEINSSTIYSALITTEICNLS